MGNQGGEAGLRSTANLLSGESGHSLHDDKKRLMRIRNRIQPRAGHFSGLSTQSSIDLGQSRSSANGLRMAVPHRASRSADDRRVWSATSGHASWMTSSWRSTISRASVWSRW